MTSSLRWHLDRLFEWIMSLVMLGLGLHLTAWPKAISHSSFRYIQDIVSPLMLTLIYTAIAGASIATLFANSKWKYGPIARAVCALARAAIWLQMTIALLKLAPEVGTPSPGLVVYSVLVLGELAAIFMATADDRFPRYR